MNQKLRCRWHTHTPCHFWVQGSNDDGEIPSSLPTALSLFLWVAFILRQMYPLYLEKKKKSPPFSKERGSEISIFERLQVWKYFYSWVTIWLVMEFLVRNTFVLAFWRNVLSSSFQHGCCDVWWCFSNLCLSGKFSGFEILWWYNLVWTFLTYWAG